MAASVLTTDQAPNLGKILVTRRFNTNVIPASPKSTGFHSLAKTVFITKTLLKCCHVSIAYKLPRHVIAAISKVV